MEWQLIITLVIVVPIVLFPVAFIWYLNIGGIISAIYDARRKRSIHKNENRKSVKTRYRHVFHG